MELRDVAAWTDVQEVQQLVTLVAEGPFDLERCTEVQNQDEYAVNHQEQAVELVIVGHQMEQVPS